MFNSCIIRTNIVQNKETNPIANPILLDNFQNRCCNIFTTVLAFELTNCKKLCLTAAFRINVMRNDVMELYSGIKNLCISYERESCYKDSPKFGKEIEVMCDLLPEVNPALVTTP